MVIKINSKEYSEQNMTQKQHSRVEEGRRSRHTILLAACCTQVKLVPKYKNEGIFSCAGKRERSSTQKGVDRDFMHSHNQQIFTVKENILVLHFYLLFKFKIHTVKLKGSVKMVAKIINDSNLQKNI